MNIIKTRTLGVFILAVASNQTKTERIAHPCP